MSTLVSTCKQIDTTENTWALKCAIYIQYIHTLIFTGRQNKILSKGPLIIIDQRTWQDFWIYQSTRQFMFHAGWRDQITTHLCFMLDVDIHGCSNRTNPYQSTIATKMQSTRADPLTSQGQPSWDVAQTVWNFPIHPPLKLANLILQRSANPNLIRGYFQKTKQMFHLFYILECPNLSA